MWAQKLLILLLQIFTFIEKQTKHFRHFVKIHRTDNNLHPLLLLTCVHSFYDLMEHYVSIVEGFAAAIRNLLLVYTYMLYQELENILLSLRLVKLYEAQHLECEIMWNSMVANQYFIMKKWNR